LELCGEMADGLDLRRRVLEQARVGMEPASPRLSYFIEGLGQALYRAGETEEGIALLEESLQLDSKIYGEDYLEVLWLQLELGKKYGQVQDHKRALSMVQRVEEIAASQTPSNKELLAESWFVKGKSLLALERTVEALVPLRAAHRFFLEMYGPDSPVTKEAAHLLDSAER
jgi:tetratricopeptide (TPR) repeat protein